MTEPTVTQADRDAMAAVYADKAAGYAAEIRGGLHDGVPLLQAFARHRTASAPAGEVEPVWVEYTSPDGNQVAVVRPGDYDSEFPYWDQRPLYAHPPAPANVAKAPQDHWTVVGAIKAARTLIKAADDLSCAAQLTGGVAGRDAALCAAIAMWTAERDKQKQVLRIIELEGDDPEIGAGVPDNSDWLARAGLYAAPSHLAAPADLVKALTNVRAQNAADMKRSGAVWEAYDRAVMDCIDALSAALAKHGGA